MKKPTIRQQINVIRSHIDILVRSYTHLIGPMKGRIVDKAIRREIQCLLAAIHQLERIKNLDAILLKTAKFIGRQHVACERDIQRLKQRKHALFYQGVRLWRIVDATATPSKRRRKN